MVEVKFLGVTSLIYSGSDQGVAFRLSKGESIGVSEATASRLLMDYPKDWEQMTGGKKKKEPDPEKEPEDPEPEAPESPEPASGKEPKKNKMLAGKKNKSFVTKNKRR